MQIILVETENIFYAKKLLLSIIMFGTTNIIAKKHKYRNGDKRIKTPNFPLAPFSLDAD
jgi:hypothetical protein